MNRFKKLVILVVPVLLSGVSVAAEEPLESDQVEKVVVTAHREEVPEEQVGSSVTVITAEELERSGKTMVLDVLRSVPGLDVARNGGPGGTTSVFLRGANPEHTLVLVDGVEVNDPISPSRAFDFGNMAVSNIERIEILRGPQSTLYGSDSLGGVIHIITGRGGGNTSWELSAEGGSFSTIRETAGVKGGGERAWYSVAVSHMDTAGVSAADEADGNDEKDGYTNRSLSARFGYRMTENLDLDLVVTGVSTDTDLDSFGVAFGDDPNSTGATEQFTVRAGGDLSLLDGDWGQSFVVSLTDYDRTFDDPVDAAHPAELSTSRYASRFAKFEWQNRLHPGRNHNLVFGLESEKEEGESVYYSESLFGPYEEIFSRKTARITGLFVQDRVNLSKTVFVTIGIRLDDHDLFGTETTYRTAFSFEPGESGTRIKGSYGTGFKAPSLFQLYSSYGNPDLAPEESLGWDAGIEQKLAGGRIVLRATWFMNDFENLVRFDNGSFTYENLARAETRGIEFTLSIDPIRSLDVQLGYTRTETEDLATGEKLLRRPGDKISLVAYYRITDDLGINLDLTQVGTREDLDFSTYPASRVELPDYTLLNLAVGWQVTGRVRIKARIENILDQQYQEVLGYGTPGLGAYLGFKLTL